jgi:hypothetical protein
MFAALLRLVARQLVCSIPEAELHISADEELVLGRGGAAAAGGSSSPVDKDGFQLPPSPAA